MILTTKGRYAVMAMVDLATREKTAMTGLGDIATRQGIPQAYLEQIFARLKRAEIVRSARGPGGGYRLAHEAQDITIAMIIDASEETIKMTRCSSETETGCVSPNTRCLTHDLWQGLGAQIHQYLNMITLEDVCKRRVLEKFPDTALQGVSLDSFALSDANLKASS
jgi:Rrf2 family iron-sulfur cluster assembly transcriptional regulator